MCLDSPGSRKISKLGQSCFETERGLREGDMIVTRLEQWKTENRLPFLARPAKKSPVTKIECVGCHSHFFRWTSTAAAYGRCDDCSKS